MKALVTGGKGFIGGALAQKLVDLGWEVTIMSRHIADEIDAKSLNYRYVFGDLGISDRDYLKKIIAGCDLVFHAGAIRNRWGTPSTEYSRVNQKGTLDLINASIGFVKRFVYVSSVGVYGFPGICNIHESFPVIKIGPKIDYHMSKVLAEEVVLGKSTEIEVVIVRPTITFGPGDNTGMVTKLISRISAGNYLQVGTGMNLIHLTYISDLVDGMILAGTSPDAANQIYNLSGCDPIPFRNITLEISKLLHSPISSLFIPTGLAMIAGLLFEQLFRAGSALKFIDPLISPPITRQMVLTCCVNRSFSSEKAKREIGYKNRVNLQEGLKKTIDWMVSEKYISSNPS